MSRVKQAATQQHEASRQEREVRETTGREERRPESRRRRVLSSLVQLSRVSLTTSIVVDSLLTVSLSVRLSVSLLLRTIQDTLHQTREVYTTLLLHFLA